MFVQRQQGFFQADGIQQLTGMPGILGTDQIDLRQHIARPRA